MRYHLDQLKAGYFKDKVQAIMLDGKGYILDSCDSIFMLKKSKLPIFDSIPALDSFADFIENLEHSPPLHFRQYALQIAQTDYICDLQISKQILDKQLVTQLLIENKTAFYEELRRLRDEKLVEAENEYIKLRSNHLLLQKERNEQKETEKERMKWLKINCLRSLEQQFHTPLHLLKGWLSLGRPEDETAIQSVLAYLEKLLHQQTIFPTNKPANAPQASFSFRKVWEKSLQSFDFYTHYKNLEIQTIFSKSFPARFRGEAQELETFFFKLNTLLFPYLSGKVRVDVRAKQDENSLFDVQMTIRFPNTWQDFPSVWEAFEKDLQPLACKFVLDNTHCVLTFQKTWISLAESLTPESTKPKKKNVQVLLLAPENQHTSFVKHFLKQGGYSYTHSTDQIHAENLLADNKFGIFIVDLSALELDQLKKIQLPSLALLPVGQRNLRQWANQSVFDDYLTQPIDYEQLIVKIKHLTTKEKIMYNEQIDLTYINDIVDGNHEMLTNLLGILQSNLEEFPQQMNEEFDNNELEKLRETAHKFKSCTAYTGLAEFNDTLTRIEKSEELGLPLQEIEEMVSFIEKASQVLGVQVQEKINHYGEEVGS